MAGETTLGISDKSRLAAFLLAFFFGCFGVHRFYVGKYGSGAAMLVLSVTVVGLLVSGFWNLIDWVLILSGNFRDKHGQLLLRWS